MGKAGRKIDPAPVFQPLGCKTSIPLLETVSRVTPKIDLIFGKDHAQNQSLTASFARPKGRAAL
ncbi:hypothetical protein C9427_00730 [Mesorhizobium helmanticense]|uniref:Uncharacterized protein n=1 Tax=Mesorhizobium helmanticense TaxID=1776423 RepID=A0A2T4J2N6_9HYPH|nr:hypothetical protein C9427_00730 [Mesorhizobium helmanticense]